jgi:hypothetical protein
MPFPAELTEEDRAYLEEIRHWQTEETGSSLIQGTRPQTPAYALTDSPTGLAAWIAEKFYVWTDHDGDLEPPIDIESLLTNITLYRVTGAINSSFWPYYAVRHEPWPVPLTPPAHPPPTRPSPARSGIRCARSPGSSTSSGGPRCHAADTSRHRRLPSCSPRT